MNKFDHIPSKLNVGHSQLAERLISLHQTVSPYTKLPSYHFEHLKKGVVCSKCNSFINAVGDRYAVCDKCGCIEDLKSVILRNVDELKLLFPDIKITTIRVYEWCHIIKSKKQIGRILKENFNMKGYGQWTYFE